MTHDSHLQSLRQELPYAFCTNRLGRLRGLDQKNERVVETMMVVADMMMLLNALEKMLLWRRMNTRYVERRQMNIWITVQSATVVGQEPILRRKSWPLSLTSYWWIKDYQTTNYYLTV